MQILLEVILVLTAFISLIPVINMRKNRGDLKYSCLKVLIYSTFIWTILIILERLSTHSFIIYYAGMLGYTLRLLFAVLMLCTIFQYVGKKVPKPMMMTLGFLVLIDLGLALTNSSTGWLLELSRTELVSFNDLYTSNYGALFVYHMVVSYIIAISAIVLLFVFLGKQKGIRQYKEVTQMMAYSVILVLLFNALQLFVVELNVNLTYISLVIVAYVLYDVIFRKDMVFNLRASGRSEILANMREMYILTDADHKIIEISPLLLEKYNLLFEDVISQPFEKVAALMADKVTLYSEYNMNEDMYEDKDHYHLREKEFKLKGMNESGHMILLYDETQVYLLLRELNQLSNYDSMTGLNNRNYIENKLKMIKDTKHIGVLSLDLNCLKINNDYLGHERGDFLLKSLADRLKMVFNDVPHKDIGRIGGDEFIVIVYETNKELLEQKQLELLKACEHPDIEQLISVSVGMAYYREGNSNIYNLIQHADAQMYEMKSIASKDYKTKLIEYIKLQDKYIR
ncbi:GGDEF domain-containing protein [Peloplasma aerotolerans]|uniref:Diguanylate cyclase n=1 Tax=Peloplasma aerotolerans TaxID=3044389 RepID=A0AAW6UC01_9MOLU|nr:GGDEF domain-containing protein [Mariniplasma sp. M4Ah]MDI6453678.1 diguanylate cyclase [Mariniplasma sp. M4Ah]